MKVVRLNKEQRRAFRRAAEPTQKLFIEMAGERGRNLLQLLLRRVEEEENNSRR